MRVIIVIFALAGLTNAARAGCAGTSSADGLARAVEHVSSSGAPPIHAPGEVHTPP